MKLITPVQIPQSTHRIDHSMKGLILGSCFAQEIGARLEAAKFTLSLNPHGILFNPISIGRAFHDIVTDRKYAFDDLVGYGGLWHSMNHHGSFSSSDPETVLGKINEPIDADFDYIIVTLGTSWVYEYRGEVVANCHKIPPSEFVRRRTGVDECIESLREIAQSGLPVILTVSPVRHIKDGLSENNLSKSILRVAAAELAEEYENVIYFPSFEIVVDELRDYRFYAEDMLHPSKVAVDYIWQRFCETFLDEDTRKLIDAVAKVRSALSHRPLHPDSADYQKFRELTVKAVRSITETCPQIDFSEELSGF